VSTREDGRERRGQLRRVGAQRRQQADQAFGEAGLVTQARQTAAEKLGRPKAKDKAEDEDAAAERD
jgi:hypothetical protein